MKINQLLEKIAFISLFLAPNLLLAQLGVNSDNSAPHASSMLDVKSATKGVLIPRVGSDLASPIEGLLYYNTTGHNFRYYDGTAWQNALFGNQWNVNGTNISYSLGRVGIGVTNPDYPLTVIGDVRFSSRLAINDPTPDYNLDVNGTAGIEVLGVGGAPDNVYPLKAYGTANLANLLVGGVTNLGSTTVNGSITVTGTTNVNGTLNANSNLAVDGAATVNNNKGVAYNTEAATNLKIHHFTTPTFTAILGPHAISAEGSLGFGGGFTSTPKLFVGDIYSTGGTVGQLYMVSLQLYNCDTNSCKARLINHSASSVNYDIRWNMMAVGY